MRSVRWVTCPTYEAFHCPTIRAYKWPAMPCKCLFRIPLQRWSIKIANFPVASTIGRSCWIGAWASRSSTTLWWIRSRVWKRNGCTVRDVVVSFVSVNRSIWRGISVRCVRCRERCWKMKTKGNCDWYWAKVGGWRPPRDIEIVNQFLSSPTTPATVARRDIREHQFVG